MDNYVEEFRNFQTFFRQVRPKKQSADLFFSQPAGWARSQSPKLLLVPAHTRTKRKRTRTNQHQPTGNTFYKHRT